MPLLNCILFTRLILKLQREYTEQDKQVFVLSYPTYPELFFQLQQATCLQSLYQLAVISWHTSGTSLCFCITIWTRRAESADTQLCKQLATKLDRASLSLQRRASGEEGDTRLIRGCGGRRTERGWFQPQRNKKPQPESDCVLCFTFSPVRAGFEGYSLKH